MLAVNVKYLNIYAEVPKKQHETITLRDEATFETLISELGEKYGAPMKEVLLDKTGKYRRNAFINGVSIYFLGGLSTKIKNGDSVTLSPR
jgi:molybdopterin converting factor small subunit